MSQLRHAALAYAARGWPVFPCHPRGKEPLLRGQHGCLDATTDAEQVRRWWTAYPTANLGLALGQGRLAFDVDGPVGEDSLLELQLRHGDLPETAASRTARGRHLFFRVPPDAAICNRIEVQPGLDLRSDGGYVLGPPSIHPTGRIYRWISPRVPLADLPGTWLALLPRRDLGRGATCLELLPPDAEPAPGARRRLDEALAWLREAREGGRHRARFEAGKRAGRLIAAGLVGRELALRELFHAARGNSTLSDRQLDQDLVSAVAVGLRWPWTEVPPGREVPPPREDEAPPWVR